MPEHMCVIQMNAANANETNSRIKSTQLILQFRIDFSRIYLATFEVQHENELNSMRICEYFNRISILLQPFRTNHNTTALHCPMMHRLLQLCRPWIPLTQLLRLHCSALVPFLHHRLQRNAQIRQTHVVDSSRFR